MAKFMQFWVPENFDLLGLTLKTLLGRVNGVKLKYF